MTACVGCTKFARLGMTMGQTAVSYATQLTMQAGAGEKVASLKRAVAKDWIGPENAAITGSGQYSQYFDWDGDRPLPKSGVLIPSRVLLAAITYATGKLGGTSDGDTIKKWEAVKGTLTTTMNSMDTLQSTQDSALSSMTQAESSALNDVQQKVQSTGSLGSVVIEPLKMTSSLLSFG